MRRTSRGGWLSRLVAKRQKKSAWQPVFEAKNRKPDKGAPVSPCKYRHDHGSPKAGVPARTWPSSDFTSTGVTNGAI